MPKVQRCRTLVLVKALPQPSKKYAETVCCAGVTLDKRWARLFPIRFRHLGQDAKFTRWQWIEYSWLSPKDDSRKESQRVIEDTITPSEIMPRRERASFLSPIVLSSVDQAIQRGQTLALVRPAQSGFTWNKKSHAEIKDEKEAYEFAASQLGLFDSELRALEPCPFKFVFSWKDDAQRHKHTCSDWEIVAMFRNFRRQYGDREALDMMDDMFNDTYPKKGFAFALGTHSRFPNSWLLVGIIRIDDDKQIPLL